MNDALVVKSDDPAVLLTILMEGEAEITSGMAQNKRFKQHTCFGEIAMLENDVYR